MSIASRITAMQEHLRDDYDVLTLAGADLTNVDKNILNLKPTWKERLLYFMNNGTQQVWDNWDKVNGTGTTLTLNNTEEAPMSLVYKGNTSQNGTPTPDNPVPIQVVSGDNSIVVCGKNLAYTGWAEDFVARINNSNHATLETFDNRNCLKWKEQAGYGDYDNKYMFKTSWKENTQYTFSFDLYTTSANNFGNICIEYTDGTMTEINGAQNQWLHKTQTSNSNKTIKYLRPNWRTGYSYIDLDTFMVYEGTETLPYEPYTGESYPISLGDIELCKIGTYQDKIDKSSGKNLFDGEIENGYINYQTGENVNGDNYRRSKNFIKVNPSTTYYLNMGNAPTGAWCGTIQYDKNKNFLEYKAWSKDTTLTTRNDTEYIRFYLNATSYDKICINVNDTNFNGEYEPYGTGWYVKKEIGKLNLSSIPFSAFNSSATNTARVVWYSIGHNYTDSSDDLCNMLPFNINIWNSDVEGFSVGNSSGYVIVRINKSTIGSTEQEATTWLSNNDLIIYAPLATPTYTLIEDSTLIEELESMKKSYENQTNISQVNNDMPFILDITALSKE